MVISHLKIMGAVLDMSEHPYFNSVAVALYIYVTFILSLCSRMHGGGSSNVAWKCCVLQQPRTVFHAYSCGTGAEL